MHFFRIPSRNGWPAVLQYNYVRSLTGARKPSPFQHLLFLTNLVVRFNKLTPGRMGQALHLADSLFVVPLSGQGSPIHKFIWQAGWITCWKSAILAHLCTATSEWGRNLWFSQQGKNHTVENWTVERVDRDEWWPLGSGHLQCHQLMYS